MSLKKSICELVQNYRRNLARGADRSAAKCRRHLMELLGTAGPEDVHILDLLIPDRTNAELWKDGYYIRFSTSFGNARTPMGGLTGDGWVKSGRRNVDAFCRRADELLNQKIGYVPEQADMKRLVAWAERLEKKTGGRPSDEHAIREILSYRGPAVNHSRAIRRSVDYDVN